MKYLLWLLPVSFFAFQFILRLWPSLMVNQIMGQFKIDATGLGLLVSVYYYGYSSMQIPLAILLDKYGARYIISISAIVCGLATLTFSFTDNLYLAFISRFLVGAGSAVGFLGVSKIVSEIFDKDQYSRMIGFSFTLGLMGAIYGGRPVNLLVEKYNWQIMALALTIVSIIIGCAIYIFFGLIKAPGSNKPVESFQFHDLKQMLSSKVIWYLGIANFLMVGVLEGFADVWGVPYLTTTYLIDKGQAAELISFIFIGMLFGGPILAFLSKKFGSYTVISITGVIMAAIFFFIIFFNNNYSWPRFASLFFLLGIMCCYQVVVFSSISELVSYKLIGITVAFLNCMNMLGGSFFHTIIGYLMDFNSKGVIKDGGPLVYSVDSYNYALLIIPVCSLLGAIITAMIGMYVRSLPLKTR